MTNSLEKYFRCIADPHPLFEESAKLSKESGYFGFGEGLVCYGRTSLGYRSQHADKPLYDCSGYLSIKERRISLPFDLDEVVKNLSHERYMRNGKTAISKLAAKVVRHAYYAARPLLPLGFRSHLQKLYFHDWQSRSFPKWPVDTTIDDLMRRLLLLKLKSGEEQSVPFIWFWPNGANACAIMTHDVEEEEGRAFCSTVMDLNDEFQIPASFQIVPERRYKVTPEFIKEIKNRRFEVAVQDLNHDGRLYWNFREFERRAEKINQYGREYDATGFRAAILYRNQEWFDTLDFEYDMSIPNVAHLDPQRGGCCTVMPYFVGDLIELPVTTSQDHSIFHILHDYSLDLWKCQISKILARNGLISFIIHPDYIIENRAREVYRNLLEELCRLRKEESVWIAHPGAVNRWWRSRDAMKLESRNGQWEIQGPDKERARVAFASIQDDQIVYTVPESQCT